MDIAIGRSSSEKENQLSEKGIQDFIVLLHEKSFRDLAASFFGYDISLFGKMLFPDNLRIKE